MAHHGLRYAVLCERRRSVLVMVYDRAMVAGRLAEAVVAGVLGGIGYPVGAEAEDCVRHLRARFGAGDGFPHEIGFFLGYPTEDVLGFMEHKGEGCKLCGLWKVYSDVGRDHYIYIFRRIL